MALEPSVVSAMPQEESADLLETILDDELETFLCSSVCSFMSWVSTCTQHPQHYRGRDSLRTYFFTVNECWRKMSHSCKRWPEE